MSRRTAVNAVVALTLLCAAPACVYTAVTRVGEQMARPIVPMDQVTIYRVAAQVPGKYVEIALLNSRGPAGFTDEEKMFKNMRYEAGMIGANAIIIDAISEPSAGAKVAAALVGVGAERKGKAVAIFMEPTAKK